MKFFLISFISLELFFISLYLFRLLFFFKIFSFSILFLYIKFLSNSKIFLSRQKSSGFISSPRSIHLLLNFSFKILFMLLQKYAEALNINFVHKHKFFNTFKFTSTRRTSILFSKICFSVNCNGKKCSSINVFFFYNISSHIFTKNCY